MAGISTSRAAQLYWLAAGLLLVWIVILYLEQPYTGRAHALVVTSVGIVGTAVGGMFTTAVLIRRHSPFAAMAAAFTGTVAFIMSWFHLLTGTAISLTGALIGTAVILAPVVAVSGWVAHRISARRATAPALTAWVPWVYVVAGTTLLILVVRVAMITPSEHDAWHLRLVWVGLDAFEFVALCATALHLQRRTPRLAVAATITGALLLSDAWFNIAASTGAAQLIAVAMGFVEIPLAVVSLLLAGRETRSWSRQDRLATLRVPDERGAQ